MLWKRSWPSGTWPWPGGRGLVNLTAAQRTVTVYCAAGNAMARR